MDMNRPTLLQDKFCTMVYKWVGGVAGDVSPLLLRGDTLPLTTILNILGLPTNKDLHLSCPYTLKTPEIRRQLSTRHGIMPDTLVV